MALFLVSSKLSTPIFFISLILTLYHEPSSCQEKLQDQFKYETILDHDNRVQLHWNVDKTNRLVQFKLVALGIGRFPFLIGFGASDRGNFINADLVVFEMASKNGNLNFIDAFTDNKGILRKDNKTNYKLENFRFKRNTLEILFNRKFDTCDLNDYRIETGTVHLIHFTVSNNARFGNLGALFSSKFRPTFDADTFDMKQSQLIKSTYFDSALAYFDSQKHKKMEVLNDRVRIPAEDTVYWCKAYRLDPKVFNLKHHIIAYESVISEASRGVAHHMELFHCLSDPPPHMKSYNGVCRSEAKPAGLTQCRKVIAAWAMGADRFVYPENVGGVIGGDNFSLYLVLEIHFDNPKMRNDIVDSSGMRIYYQGGKDEQLREYDAGIMEIGLEYNSKNSIPPQVDAFHLHGHCLSECTKASFGSTTITVFASQLHTHLTGRRVWTSLIRDNKVVKLLNSDNHFDQMFQEIRMLESPVEILPGDALVNTCIYETNDRKSMTFGGYSIRDEMCVNYMHYYPAVSLELCKSSIGDSVLSTFFEKMRYFDRSNTSSSKSIEQNFNSIRWTPMTSAMLSRLYDTSPISFSCNRSDGEYVESVYGKQGGKRLFKPIRAKNLTNMYAPVNPSLRETSCVGTARDYGSEDDEEEEEQDYFGTYE